MITSNIDLPFGSHCDLIPQQAAVSGPLPDGKANIITLRNLNAKQLAYYVVVRAGTPIAQGSLKAAGEAGSAKTVSVEGGATVKVINTTDNDYEQVCIRVTLRQY